MTTTATLTTQPVLVLPLFLPNVEVNFRGWMGGALYIRNLAHVLSDLPAAERPRIVILTDGGLDAGLPRALFNEAAVEGIFDPAGTPLAVKPALAPLILDAAGKPDSARITAVLDGASAIFPVLRSMFNPRTALHWIPDFQHKYLPEMFDATEIANRDTEFRIMTHSRLFVLVSSEAGRADLVRFYPTATAKTYVWHFTSALDPTAAPPTDPRPAFGLPARYLFAPNQFWKHKDHRTLFQAMAILRDRGCDAVLACTGRAVDARHPAYADELQRFVADRAIADRVRFLGVVPDTTLRELFRHAAAVVQPSLFEGWSTVVEDAKATGRPIILTDLPVHREQAEDAGPFGSFTFFSPGDAPALADAIEAAWPGLSAGPDPVTEAGAAARRRLSAQSSARRFMAIMADMRASVA
jgi:glycosyltransferase involved in cell wall biosynthesis